MANAVRNKEISIIHRCKPLSISHLLFTDNLMIFVKADRNSILVAMEVMKCFSSYSGLSINRDKSTILMGGVNPSTKLSLIDCCGFPEGSLPVKYLGVPLIALGISHTHYGPIIDKIRMRMEGWKSQILSLL
ncbi:hypothetical protein NE237_002409 [Protea cynaroides]|uniref:Reverse transcriptase n=1 Tax=Protea cynaroides TaxID=273540 RepID=A0A9Q0KUX0_9MAGN|nr:hypothetical protein NE237_002409 [Protea cynaroides]